MSLQFYQIATLLTYIVLGVLVWKIKNKWVRMFIVGTALIMFLVNPVRFKQEGMSKIERRSTGTIIELPKRIIVNQKSFSEKQSDEMNQLKTQSIESVKNETN